MSGGQGGQQQYGQQPPGGGNVRDSGQWSDQPPPNWAEPQAPGTTPGATPGASPSSAGSYGSPNPYSGGYGGPIQPAGPAYGSGGGIPIQRPGNWYSVPHLQTYGGQAAPFSDLSAQILNAMQMTQQGAGRFNANAAARYGYQGGVQQWRPDANPWGQPIMPYQWQPQWNPPTANPPPSGGGGTPPPGGGGGTPPPGGGGGTPPPGGGGAGGAVDHAANFRALLAEDPRLAQEYRVRNGDTIGWWQKNGLSMFGGDQNAMNDFANRNSPQSSNVAPLTMEEMRRLNQMAGIRSPY